MYQSNSSVVSGIKTNKLKPAFFTVIKRFFLFSFLVFLNLNVFGEKQPIKYGKVDKTEIDMKVYPQDSSATAVVLCEYGYYNSAQNQFSHTIRIKVLKEEGKSSGNFYVPAAEKTNVRGQTLNMENGQPVITKLTKEGIFIEKITRDYYRARVAMPNVKVGSVIDVEFYYNGFPQSWSFQKMIPVKWSEIIIEQSQYVSFHKTYTGFVPISESSDDRWVIKNVPAFVPEPYINNSQNYITKFEFEVQSIHVPGYLYKNIATDWNSVVTTLNDDDYFGRKITDLNIFLNGLSRNIKSTSASPKEMMKKAFQEIKKFKWNGEETIWVSDFPLETTYNKKYGNVAEVNLSLIILLKKLGLEVHPVVLSSRSNGTLPRFAASLRKLNYVIAQVVIDNETFYLDATEEFTPVNLLPERARNETGLVLLKDNQFLWADLLPVKTEKTLNIFNVKMAESGALSGTCNVVKYDYAAYNQRKKFKSFNSEEEYLKYIESNFQGIAVTKYVNKNLDSIDLPLIETYDVDLRNYATKISNQYFISPFLFEKYKENPFKIENRLYPVDFSTPIEHKDIFIMEIPDGFSVVQMPQNIKMSIKDNNAVLLMQSIKLNEKTVQVIFSYIINKPIFYQLEYPDLKSFFDELVKKQAEMIQINKTI